jgi:hypothetical protein
VTVSVDVSKVVRGMRKLSKGLDRIPNNTGLRRAHETAARVAELTPVLTGRLRSTVTASPIRGGGAVHYGGTLPYANKIERSQHPVEQGIADAANGFQRDMTDAAAKEVNSL